MTRKLGAGAERPITRRSRSARLHRIMLTSLALLSLCAPASAQTGDGSERAVARKLGYAGVEAYQAGQFAVASEKLEKAYAVLHAPSLGLWSARALVKRDKLIEAAERYVEVSRLVIAGGDVEVQKKAQADAHTELEATQAITPTVTIRVQGAEANAVALKIDGASVSSGLLGEPTPLNPGRHRIEGQLGEARAEQEVSLQQRDEKDVLLRFEAAGAASAAAAATPESPPTSDSPPGAPTSASSSPRRTLAWVAVGAGAAGIVVGGVVAGLAASKRKSLDANPLCADDHSCPPSQGGEVNSYNSLRTVSTIGFVAGGVLAATGVVLLLTAPKSSATASASLWLSPTSLKLSGSF